MQKIMPFLWFNNQAEEAAIFYATVFKNSKILNVARYPEDAPDMAGMVMLVDFRIEECLFTAVNVGSQHVLSDGVFFVIHCSTQEEIEKYRSKLSEGGKEEKNNGWIKDKFGLSWQFVYKNDSVKTTTEKAFLQIKNSEAENLKKAS